MLNFTYCDQSQLLGFSQSANIASNLIFFLIAAYFWHLHSHCRHRYGLIAIGVSSMIWHASHWQPALFLDIGSIVMWVILYCQDALRHRLLTSRTCWLIIGIGGIISLIFALALRPWLPYMSGAFMPYLMICLFLAINLKESAFQRFTYAYGSLFMGLAIIFRETDWYFCHIFPIGTHFLWHICAGFSLLPLLVHLKNPFPVK